MDGLSFLRAVAALAFTLALLVGFAVLLRKYGHKLGMIGAGSTAATGKRLKLIEILNLDMRHRVVLLEKDGDEFLVLLGPGGASITAAQNNDGPRP